MFDAATCTTVGDRWGLGRRRRPQRRRRQTDQLQRADHTARGGHGEPGQLMEFVVDEIALGARISRVAANNRLDLAQDLTRALPAVFELLQAGTIDLSEPGSSPTAPEPSTVPYAPPSPIES